VKGNCKSNYCGADGLCADPPCSNGTLDTGETGVDCGGVCVKDSTGTCEDGIACAADTDCTSGYCPAGTLVCTADYCKDGAKTADTDETDVDCGGARCAKCGDAKACTGDTDCASGKCNGTICISACTGITGSISVNGVDTPIACGDTTPIIVKGTGNASPNSEAATCVTVPSSTFTANGWGGGDLYARKLYVWDAAQSTWTEIAQASIQSTFNAIAGGTGIAPYAGGVCALFGPGKEAWAWFGVN